MTRGPVPNHFPRRPGPLRLALVGEAPGAAEVEQGAPFVGSSGHLLNSALSSVGVAREECFVGNVCQWRPTASGNDFSSLAWEGEEVQAGIEALRQELATFQPNVVVCLGSVPLHLFKQGNTAPPKTPASGYKWPSKITSWRGSLFEAHPSHGYGWKCLATWHPAYVLRVYSKLFDLRQDLRRAREEASTPVLSLPEVQIVYGPALA